MWKRATVRMKLTSSLPLVEGQPDLVGTGNKRSGWKSALDAGDPTLGSMNQILAT